VSKIHEASHGFSLRLQAAFDEIADDVTVKQMQAFVMLRQSGLSSEDKKKILTMTNGKLDLTAVDQAMRSLSTRVLMGPGESKKKNYPINFSEVDVEGPHSPVR
jgi:deoxyxylulose-5-phosphate synthase